MQGFVDISILCTFKRMRDILQLAKSDDKLSKDKVPQETVAGVRLFCAACYACTSPLLLLQGRFSGACHGVG